MEQEGSQPEDGGEATSNNPFEGLEDNPFANVEEEGFGGAQVSGAGQPTHASRTPWI
jgi:hypothetical protein